MPNEDDFASGNEQDKKHEQLFDRIERVRKAHNEMSTYLQETGQATLPVNFIRLLPRWDDVVSKFCS